MGYEVNYRCFIKLVRVYFPEYSNYYVNQSVIQTVFGIWIMLFVISLAFISIILND